MDNYKLEEVKNIIDNNLLTPEVLENILKSTTRRIETYDDNEALDILNYLSKCDTIPDETKEHISKYLAEYDTFKIESNVQLEEKKIGFNKVMFVYILVIVALILVIAVFYFYGRE